MPKLTANDIKMAHDAYARGRVAELGPAQTVIAQAISGLPLPPSVRTADAAQGLAFFISQLAYTEAGIYTRQYTPMQYQRFVPVSSEAGEWAENIRYQTYDGVAMGRRASSKPDDINLVDVEMADKKFDVAPGDIGYHYTQQEIIQSAYLRNPLSNARMVMAMEGFQRHMNKVALWGEGSDLYGLLKNPNVPKGNAPKGTWATATPDEILKDLQAMLMTPFTASSNNDVPNTILLPAAQFAILSDTPRSQNSDTTILSFFKENNLYRDYTGGQINVFPAFGLETAGTGGGTRAVAYVNSQDRCIMHIPMPLKFLAPQLRGQAVYVPGMYRYSGVEVRYPKSMYYMEGI